MRTLPCHWRIGCWFQALFQVGTKIWPLGWWAKKWVWAFRLEILKFMKTRWDMLLHAKRTWLRCRIQNILKTWYDEWMVGMEGSSRSNTKARFYWCIVVELFCCTCLLELCVTQTISNFFITSVLAHHHGTDPRVGHSSFPTDHINIKDSNGFAALRSLLLLGSVIHGIFTYLCFAATG